MTLIDESVLEAFFSGQDRPTKVFLIEEIEEARDAYYLGQVGVAKRRPSFRFGYWFGLSDSSRFCSLPFDFPDIGAKGTAVIFRQWDSSPDEDEPHELFSGWVPVGMAEQVEAWIALMNERIAALLAQE